MNRKQRRARGIKNAAESEISQSLSMFEKLPDECTACLKVFSKKSKEMAMTWNVIVKDQNTVRLYCPECWSSARKAVEIFREQNDLTGENKDER